MALSIAALLALYNNLTNLLPQSSITSFSFP